MSIVKVISATNAGANLNYLINEKAHNTELTSHRSLKFSGQNVYGDYANKVNARYLADQFWAVRQRAKNQNKKVQVHHLIFSFSQQEFNPTKENLLQQARQALKLVNDFLHQLLPSTAQYLEAVQCDSKGKNLHVHVSCNSVLTNGKVLDTNLISVNSRTVTKNKKYVHHLGIRNKFDNYMSKNFKKLTGREFKPVKENKINLVNSKAVKIDERGGYIWKEDLKERILDAFNNTDNLEDFEAVLEANNGVKVKHRRASIGKDEHGKKIYRDAITYTFIGDDFASHSARDFGYTKGGGKRGLGLSFTPQSIQHEFKQRRRKNQQSIQEQTETNPDTSQQTNAEQLQQLHQQQLLQQKINQQLLNHEESEDDIYGNQSKKSVSVQKYKSGTSTTAEFDTSAYDAETKKRQLNNQRQRDQIQRQRSKATKRQHQPASNQPRANIDKYLTKPSKDHQPHSTNSRQSNQPQPVAQQHQSEPSGPRL
ncbi:relaxase/mobilization nuclease domain-containing protein [Limosilactobacillus reuteri]|uniref:relaxase/mobilization nuclease domain-containing protein n=1 Tax=Limosilactobacillus reuteri TaxID=1598 RepID=UPI001C5B63C9|nr:relaxase/mobilization nuclease domain-containing protein [Limosilactobacillus reuteri]MBW3351344.1 relaxase/mobilization nuclease domain-containing protein [Limosilactobacillus reuteri]UUW69736.1 relaxase/mobilization nuclease domain-containing protein [Limosilactobacillus reuteri]